MENNCSWSPKLIVSDVDGTLLDKSEGYSSEFEKLAELIQNYGLPFTLASGRSPDMIAEIVEKLHITLPVIVSNGAAAITRTGCIWNDYFNPMQIKEAVLTANSLDMAIIMDDGEGEAAYRHNAYIQEQIEKYNRYNRFYIPLEREWPDLKLQKLLIIDPEQEGRIDVVLDKLEPYKDDLNIIRYNDRSADIMPKTASKGKALKRLADQLNIDLEDILVFGDEQNDIEMFDLAGVGAAVQNAVPELKKHADYICKHDVAGGVLEAIETFCALESAKGKEGDGKRVETRG